MKPHRLTPLLLTFVCGCPAALPTNDPPAEQPPPGDPQPQAPAPVDTDDCDSICSEPLAPLMRFEILDQWDAGDPRIEISLDGVRFCASLEAPFDECFGVCWDCWNANIDEVLRDAIPAPRLCPHPITDQLAYGFQITIQEGYAAGLDTTELREDGERICWGDDAEPRGIFEECLECWVRMMAESLP